MGCKCPRLPSSPQGREMEGSTNSSPVGGEACMCVHTEETGKLGAVQAGRRND